MMRNEHMLTDTCLSTVALRVGVGVESCTVVFLRRDFQKKGTSYLRYFFGHFCCRMYRLATNGEKADGTKSRLQFETVYR